MGSGRPAAFTNSNTPTMTRPCEASKLSCSGPNPNGSFISSLRRQRATSVTTTDSTLRIASPPDAPRDWMTVRAAIDAAISGSISCASKSAATAASSNTTPTSQLRYSAQASRFVLPTSVRLSATITLAWGKTGCSQTSTPAACNVGYQCCSADCVTRELDAAGTTIRTRTPRCAAATIASSVSPSATYGSTMSRRCCAPAIRSWIASVAPR